jgi:hypothetical protein
LTGSGVVDTVVTGSDERSRINGRDWGRLLRRLACQPFATREHGCVVTGEKKSFWSGMSGFLAGTTALLTAVGGLIAILIQVGAIGGNGGSNGGGETTESAAWAPQANDICARANDLITALPNPKTLGAQAALTMGQQALRINRQMVRDLAKVPQPDEQRADVNEFLRLGANVNDNTEELLADLTSGSVADAQQRLKTLSRLGKKFDSAAIGLGASTCAEGASFSGGLPVPAG